MSDLDEVSKEKILKIAQKMAWNDLEEDKKDKYKKLAEIVWSSIKKSK